MARPEPAGEWRVPALSRAPGHGVHEFGALPEQAVPGRQSESASPDRQQHRRCGTWRSTRSSRSGACRPTSMGRRVTRVRSAGAAKPKDMAVAATGNNTAKTLAGEPNPKHLYNSYDDYLIASISDAKIGGKATDIDIKERRPVGDKNDQTAGRSHPAGPVLSDHPQFGAGDQPRAACPACRSGRSKRASARNSRTPRRAASGPVEIHHLRHPDRVQHLAPQGSHRLSLFLSARER